MRKLIKKALGMPTGPEKLIAADTQQIRELKKRFEHSDREFFHGNKRYMVDCLYCHAVPGTIELTLTELGRLLKERPGANALLNLGGGTGQVSALLEETGFLVTTLDLEITQPDSRHVQHDLNSERELPFERESFDYILCQEVIEHIENPWKLFRQMHRALKKDGFLVLTTPNIQSSYSKKLFQKSGYFHWFTPDCFSYHVNPLPKWEVELIAGRSGFTIAKLQGNGEYYFRRDKDPDPERQMSENECLIFLMRKKAANA